MKLGEKMAVKNKETGVSVKKKTHEVVIGEYYDGFAIVVDGKEFYFNQEDSVEGLVEVFKAVGCVDVTYEEVY